MYLTKIPAKRFASLKFGMVKKILLGLTISWRTTEVSNRFRNLKPTNQTTDSWHTILHTVYMPVASMTMTPL